jgi:hypothetical protein
MLPLFREIFPLVNIEVCRYATFSSFLELHLSLRIVLLIADPDLGPDFNTTMKLTLKTGDEHCFR